MASSDTSPSQLLLVLTTFCQILDEGVDTSESATSSIRNVLRHLTYVSGSTIGTEEWDSMLNENVRSCAKALTQFFTEEIHLPGDLQSQISHLQDHPRLLSNSGYKGWNTCDQRLALPILCLKLLQALGRLDGKNRAGKDISHLVKTIPVLYENTSKLSQALQKSAMNGIKINSPEGRDIATPYNSSDSSDNDSDSSQNEWVHAPAESILTLLGRKDATPPSTVASEKEAITIPVQASQTILHRTQAVTFFPKVFDMDVTGNCPQFGVRVVHLDHDKIDEAQLFEENVSIASTWYFTVTMTNHIPGDVTWRHVDYLIEADMSEHPQAATEIPDNVHKMLMAITSSLTARDPFNVFAWSLHLIGPLRSKFRAIIKRTLVTMENPQQAYKIMSELEYRKSPMAPPPRYRGTAQSQINIRSPKLKPSCRIQKAVVRMEDIYSVPKIDGNVTEMLMKRYVRSRGIDTSPA